MAGSVGSLGSVSYDIVAADKSGAGLESARSNFVVTAGDIVNALESVASKLAEFDVKNAELNTDLGITALNLGMNAEELRGWAGELSNATDPITEMAGVIDALARGGITTHDAMMSTAEGFDQLADAIGGSSDKVTSDMIPAFKAFNVPLQDVGKYTDILAYTFNATEVTADSFSNVVRRMGPELNAAGVGMDDMAALMLILKDRGYDGRNMMQEFTAAMSSTVDANEDGVVSFEEMLASMKITNTEFDTTKTKLETVSQGYAEQAAQVRNDNLPVQEQYNNSIDNTVLGLGGLTSPITSAASLFGSFASTISSIAIPAMVLFPAKFAAIGPAISSAVSGLSGSVSTAGTALGGSMVAGVAIGVALGLAGVWILLKTGVLDALSKAGQEISKSPIGNIIMSALKVALAPVGSLGAAIIDIVKGDFASIPEDMAEPFRQAGDVVSGAIDYVKEFVSIGVSEISERVSDIGSAFGNIGGTISGALSSVPGLLSNTFADISSAFSFLGSEVQTAFSSVFTGISDYIVNLAQGFISAGYNIIMYIVQGMQSAAGSVGSAISGVLSTIWNFLPHSPALEGPLSKLPDFSSYFTQGLEASIPAVQNASMEVMANILPSAQPAAMGTGTSIGSQDNSASISIGNINASRDYDIQAIMADIAAMQAQKRAQRGVPSG